MITLRRHPGWAVLVFALSAWGLHLGLTIPWVQNQLLVPYTDGVAAVSRALLAAFLSGIEGQDGIIRQGTFAIRVLNVCNGTDLWILFAAAVLAFPATWPTRGLGLLVGLPLLAVVNLIRVVGLFVTGRFAPSLFELSHLFLWQVALILITAGVFAGYLRWARARDEVAS